MTIEIGYCLIDKHGYVTATFIPRENKGRFNQDALAQYGEYLKKYHPSKIISDSPDGLILKPEYNIHKLSIDVSTYFQGKKEKQNLVYSSFEQRAFIKLANDEFLNKNSNTNGN